MENIIFVTNRTSDYDPPQGWLVFSESDESLDPDDYYLTTVINFAD